MSGKVPILMYHKVGLPSPIATQRGLHTSPAALDRQLAFLTRSGFTFCDFQDLRAAARGERPLPEHPVLITFDDGHLDNYTAGLPVLRAHGAKATVFVVVADVGRRGVVWPEAAEVEPMSFFDWDQAAQLQAAGVRIEVHGWNHRRMDQLAPDTLAEELERCRDELRRHLGYSPIALAYPDGAWNPACREVVRGAGFEFACTTEDRAAQLEHDEPLGLPRLTVRGYRWIHGWRFRRTISRLASGYQPKASRSSSP